MMGKQETKQSTKPTFDISAASVGILLKPTGTVGDIQSTGLWMVKPKSFYERRKREPLPGQISLPRFSGSMWRQMLTRFTPLSSVTSAGASCTGSLAAPHMRFTSRGMQPWSGTPTHLPVISATLPVGHSRGRVVSQMHSSAKNSKRWLTERDKPVSARKEVRRGSVARKWWSRLPTAVRYILAPSSLRWTSRHSLWNPSPARFVNTFWPTLWRPPVSMYFAGSAFSDASKSWAAIVPRADIHASRLT